MMLRVCMPIVVAILISGCVPANVKELEDTGSRDVVTHSGNWQESYRTLHTHMLECYDIHGFAGANLGQVHGQLYDELKLGEIVATYQKGPFSMSAGPYIQLRVTPDGGGSKVEILNTGTLGKGVGKQVRGWLDGSLAGCR